MKTFILGLKLLIVTATAGLTLGFVQHITAGPIAREQARQRQIALKETLPNADSFEDIPTPRGFSMIKAVTIGKKDGHPVGANITCSSPGYGGPVVFIIGVDSKGVVQGLKVTEHTETPGLGANSVKPWFQDRFIGASGVIEVVKGEVEKEEQKADTETSASKKAETGGKKANFQVQAITGATVTSSAIARGVNQALDMFQRRLRKEMKK